MRPQKRVLMVIHRPYVYHVHAHDLDDLRNAILSALTRPILSFVPEHMTFDWVSNRMAYILDEDWKGKARKVLEYRLDSGDGQVGQIHQWTGL